LHIISHNISVTGISQLYLNKSQDIYHLYYSSVLSGVCT